ncbi:MAG: hypothetical protein WAW92_03400, partial [Minisyncoccia bacterium]
WYTTGTAVAGAILTHPKMNVDPKIEISGLTKKEFDVFFKFTSINISDLKDRIEKEVAFNDEYVYTFNPLEYYPLIKIDHYYYCPIINFLMWKITSGLYFDLISGKNDTNFGSQFGLAFQDYLEEISNKVLDIKRVKIIPEQKNKVGKNYKDSVDLILHQNNFAFFVEAKAKRMQALSKSQLISDDAMDKDLEILADDIIQVYLTILDYKNNYYSNFPYKKENRIYPLLVTLEDWFLIGNDSDNLTKKVTRKLEESGLPSNTITDMPFIVCSTYNYEQLIQVLNKYDIKEITNNWFVPDKKGHNFGQFIRNTYKEGIKYIDDFFPGDFEKIYPIGMVNIKKT